MVSGVLTGNCVIGLRIVVVRLFAFALTLAWALLLLRSCERWVTMRASEDAVNRTHFDDLLMSGVGKVQATVVVPDVPQIGSLLASATKFRRRCCRAGMQLPELRLVPRTVLVDHREALSELAVVDLDLRAVPNLPAEVVCDLAHATMIEAKKGGGRGEIHAGADPICNVSFNRLVIHPITKSGYSCSCQILDKAHLGLMNSGGI